MNSVENAERTAARSDVLMTSGGAEADAAGVWRSGDDLGANWTPVAQAETTTMQMKVLRNCLKRAPLFLAQKRAGDGNRTRVLSLGS